MIESNLIDFFLTKAILCGLGGKSSQVYRFENWICELPRCRQIATPPGNISGISKFSDVQVIAMKVGNGKTNSDKLESSLSLKKTKNDYYLRDNYMDYEQIEHL